MTGWRPAVLLMLAGSAGAACPGDETHYRLYRSSAAIQGAAIQVATFDAPTAKRTTERTARVMRGNSKPSRV
jgi:hypothetical protein